VAGEERVGPLGADEDCVAGFCVGELVSVVGSDRVWEQLMYEERAILVKVNPSTQAIFLIYIHIIDRRTSSRSWFEKWYLGVL
jgi:hypothetical protein